MPSLVCRYVVSSYWNSLVILPILLERFLHYARGIAEVKCIVVRAVCVSVPCCIPTLLHRLGCKLGDATLSGYIFATKAHIDNRKKTC